MVPPFAHYNCWCLTYCRRFQPCQFGCVLRSSRLLTAVEVIAAVHLFPDKQRHVRSSADTYVDGQMAYWYLLAPFLVEWLFNQSLQRSLPSALKYAFIVPLLKIDSWFGTSCVTHCSPFDEDLNAQSARWYSASNLYSGDLAVLALHAWHVSFLRHCSNGMATPRDATVFVLNWFAVCPLWKQLRRNLHKSLLNRVGPRSDSISRIVYAADLYIAWSRAGSK